MSESKEDESSLLRDRASPDHDGTVGLYPVTEATLTLVPWIFVTQYVAPPSRMTSPPLRFDTKEPESCPRIEPSALNTR